MRGTRPTAGARLDEFLHIQKTARFDLFFPDLVQYGSRSHEAAR